jgi:hypothetical protein
VARSESKRQKRLAKQKTKRNEKRHAHIRLKNMGLAERLARFETAPILDCLVNEEFEDKGMASLLISRKAASGEVAMGIFLVDTYCLGVKDCFGLIANVAEYGERLESFRKQGVRPIDPPSARRLVEDAVAYAASFGLAAYADFRKIRPILDGIDPELAREIFPMGKNGKPMFMPGPSQSVEETRRIKSLLDKHCGPEGYKFMIPALELASLASRLNHDAFDDMDFDEDSDEFDDD